MYDPERGYQVVVPCVLYDDIPAAVEWLTITLGFREIVRAVLPDGWTGHAELERDGLVLLLGRCGGQFDDASGITQVFVDDVDVRCPVAAAARGTVLVSRSSDRGGFGRPPSRTRRGSGGCSPATFGTSTPRSGSVRCSRRSSARGQ
jgi:hypothetical protein